MLAPRVVPETKQGQPLARVCAKPVNGSNLDPNSDTKSVRNTATRKPKDAKPGRSVRSELVARGRCRAVQLLAGESSRCTLSFVLSFALSGELDGAQ
jgi:hypothetical protein